MLMTKSTLLKKIQLLLELIVPFPYDSILHLLINRTKLLDLFCLHLNSITSLVYISFCRFLHLLKLFPLIIDCNCVYHIILCFCPTNCSRKLWSGCRWALLSTPHPPYGHGRTRFLSTFNPLLEGNEMIKIWKYSSSKDKWLCELLKDFKRLKRGTKHNNWWLQRTRFGSNPSPWECKR